MSLKVGDKVTRVKDGVIGTVIEVDLDDKRLPYLVEWPDMRTLADWETAGAIEPVEVVTIGRPTYEAKAQDLLTRHERAALEYCRNDRYVSHVQPLIEALDRLAPKPVEAVKPVSGWEAIEDMRKRPEALYRSADGRKYRFTERLEHSGPSQIWFHSSLSVDSLNIVDWVKLA